MAPKRASTNKGKGKAPPPKRPRRETVAEEFRGYSLRELQQLPAELLRLRLESLHQVVTGNKKALAQRLYDALNPQTPISHQATGGTETNTSGLLQSADFRSAVKTISNRKPRESAQHLHRTKHTVFSASSSPSMLEPATAIRDQ